MSEEPKPRVIALDPVALMAPLLGSRTINPHDIPPGKEVIFTVTEETGASLLLPLTGLPVGTRIIIGVERP